MSYVESEGWQEFDHSYIQHLAALVRCGVVACAWHSRPRACAEVKVTDFGKTADGTPVKAVHDHQRQGRDVKAHLARRDARRMARAG